MTSTGTRIRALIVAFGCDATDVGESWSNHQWISRLAQEHDVTLLVNTPRHRPRAETQLDACRVVEWRDPPLLNKARRFNAMAKPGYLPFYAHARKWIRAAVRDGARFDIAHQLSPLAIRYPSPLVGLGLPFIVGPLAGSIATPAGFAGEVRGGAWYTRLRAIDRIRFERDPMLRRTIREAAAVIGVAPYVQELLDGIGIRRFELMSETGVVELPPPKAVAPADDTRLRMLFVGRLVRTKGVRDAVRAMAQLTDLPDVTLDVVGDGEDRNACEAEAERLSLASRVRFHGRVDRAAVDDFYRSSDVFLFPSFREPSGNVVLEAMSHSLPVVTCSAGGPAYVVNEDSGIRVDATDPTQYAADLAAAVRRLASDRGLVARLGAGARARVADIALWDRKAAWMTRLYRSILDQHGQGQPADPDASPAEHASLPADDRDRGRPA